MENKLLKMYEKKTFQELYSNYYENKRNFLNNGDKKSKILMKIIEKVIDTKNIDQSEKNALNNSYISYPEYNDPEFNDVLSKKAEFFHCKGLLDLEELDKKCYPTHFELGNHQKFLKNFMNKNTPYKGILVFHGVGVGKTCTAVTISSSFIDLYKKEDKKIICLVSKNIQPNWMNTIYNPEKGDNQCNGETFQNIIHNIDMKVNTASRVKKLIKEYYEFYGYQQFSNKVKKLIEVKLNKNPDKSIKEIEKNVINKYFSNRLLIIDEIHNLRDDNLDKYSKDTIKFLDKVIKYSDNLRLVLLSATPMFNKATEIQWLLNLLLKNDKRPTISKNELFDKDGNLTNVKLFEKKIRGYVSYVRGENPITFPIRLYPDDNQDNSCINGVSIPYPNKNMKDGNIYSEDVHKFKFLKMYHHEFLNDEKEGYQLKVYDNYVKNLQNENIQITEQRAGVQISNVVFPSINVLLGNEEITGDNYLKMYGGSGLLKSDTGIMKMYRRNVYRYSNNYKKNIPYPIFDVDHIGKISCKIKGLLEGFIKDKPKGIIFIYTEFIPSGILPLAFALEHLGFEKNTGNLLDYPEWKKDSKPGTTKREPIDYNWNTKKAGQPFKRAKYAVLSGNKDISPNNVEEIKQLVSDKNAEGENIKIVIGNVVASEGLDLKNIREIHVLDPWYHLSRIEQIIGRGIRYCSHIKLDKEERNVTVYLHVGMKDKETESIDTYTYRKAEEKAMAIGFVEKILKENAIDCYLNKEINHIKKKQIKPVDLISSRGKKISNHDISDVSFSKVCSFSECDYKCNSSETIKEEEINYDTFTMKNSKDLFIQAKKVIGDLFYLNNYYTLDEITDRVIKTIDISITVVYYTLFDMIDNKIHIWNKNGISGYIINKNNLYLFQPHNSKDDLLPLYYRNEGSSKSDNVKYITLEGTILKQIISDKKIFDFDGTYKKLLNTLSTKIVDRNNLRNMKFDEIIPGFNDELLNSYILDCLSYEEKTVILKTIVKEYIINNTLDDDTFKLIFNHFKLNLIYEKDEKYTILEKNGNVIGFFVFNTDSFFNKKRNKLKETDSLEDDYDYFIFKNDTFYESDELEDGLLIKGSIKKNISEIQKKHPIFKVSDFWGFPYKKQNNKNFLKVVAKPGNINNIPGRVIQEIAQKDVIISYIAIFFREYHERFKEINYQQESKGDISILLEMILRNEQKKNTSSKNIFIPYDLLFFKYMQF